MKKLFAVFLIIYSVFANASGKFDYLDHAKGRTKFLEQTIKNKDIPATCWFLGQIRADVAYLRNEKQILGDKLLKLVDEVSGRCGGAEKSQDLSSVYNESEWTRLRKGIEEIKNFKAE